MSLSPSSEPGEIVDLGDAVELTRGIGIGNLKDESRVGWRPFTVEEGDEEPPSTPEEPADPPAEDEG